jgi:hypothetical protein
MNRILYKSDGKTISKCGAKYVPDPRAAESEYKVEVRTDRVRPIKKNAKPDEPIGGGLPLENNDEVKIDEQES